MSRQEWLAAALDVLSKEGEAKLRIDQLTASLGVTKGSFYWHFADRADFVRRIAEYWAESMTQAVIEETTRRRHQRPQEELFQIAELVTRKNYGRYDIVMRAWAQHELNVAPIVKQADRARYATVRRAFASHGFRGEELEMRTRIFTGFFSVELGLTPRETQNQRRRRLKRKIRFFTKP